MIEVKYDNADERSGGQWYEIGPAVIRFPYNANEERCEQAKKNADLIAEAFNVRDLTGLTPRQLVEQRGRLLAALKLAVERFNRLDSCVIVDAESNRAYEAAVTAISAAAVVQQMP